MRVWYRTLFIIVLSLIITQINMAQDNNDDLPPDGNIVIVDSAFVRGGPSNDYLAVGALFAGDEVTPLNISEDGAWILIPYSRSTGWVQRSLIRWEDNASLDLLPILPANFTPTPRVAITNTPFIPTSTPDGNYINVEGAASAYVRAGPGRGYLRLGQLLPGENVEAIARNDDTSWIMIRFTEEELDSEFGWLAFELVYWEELDDLENLPIIEVNNLTPTVTFTPSQTPSATSTATQTDLPTFTPSPTLTETLLPSATLTNTLEPTATETNTSTPQPTVTETSTVIPTSTATATSTSVPTETETATPIPSNTPEPSVTPSETFTALPTETATPIPPTNTPEPSITPSETNTALPTETETASSTPTSTTEPSLTPTDVLPTATETVITSANVVNTPDTPTQATATATDASPTDIFVVEATSVSSVITQAVEPSPQAPFSNILNEDAQLGRNFSIPIEALVGIIILLIILGYIWFFWQGLSAVGRYSNGFIIETCPVCQRGDLHLDERPSRILGIPRVRRTVRCDVCRSVLRETGTRRWRYAVDRIENPTMFDRFNGRQITDADLERLAKTPPIGARAKTSPEFMETDSEE